MIHIITSLGIGIGLMGFLLFIRWLLLVPPTPDPWEDLIDKKELDENAKPVCLKCSRPVKAFNQHYCPNCGNVTGEYTRYIPFVNIQFNYSIFSVLWKKLGDKNSCFISKILYLILIIILAPIMLVVGIPVIIFNLIIKKLKK